MSGEWPVPETAVEPADRPAPGCPYCDRPFTTPRLRDLHVGEIHPGACTPGEWKAYEEARAAERDDLFTYHINVVIALGVIYALMVLALMVLLGGKF